MIHNPAEFVNAQIMSGKHPDTFYAPTAEELAEVKEGWYVKVSVEGERFWVLVGDVKGDVVSGKVDNDLVYTDRHGLACGDRVRFKLENVYQILEPDGS